MAIWYIFPRFGMLCHVESGNPGLIASYCVKMSHRFFMDRMSTVFCFFFLSEISFRRKAETESQQFTIIPICATVTHGQAARGLFVLTRNRKAVA
jgi:hypothetical protein